MQKVGVRFRTSSQSWHALLGTAHLRAHPNFRFA